MFSDADDVWYSGKIRKSIEAILEEERISSKETPIIVHTDMAVIDGTGSTISPSIWNFLGRNPLKERPFSKILIDNFVYAPTVIINRPLLNYAMPIPGNVRSHDWWVALVASAFGRIKAIPYRSMSYRRHGKNDSGLGKKMTFVARLRSIVCTIMKPEKMRSRAYELIASGQVVARIFLDRYRSELTERHILILETFSKLEELPAWKRKLCIIQNGLWFDSIIVNVGFVILA